ncbi:hypothetical protein CR513_21433, partial [Mucuna pruriens]
MMKQCLKYVVCRVKNDKFLTLICSEVNLTFILIPKDTWWVDFGATTHAIESFRLQLKIGFHLDSFETFVMISFKGNLISISSLDKFGFSCSFGNNKVSLYQNSNVVGYGSLIDNLYMLDVVSFHNEILQTGSRGHIFKQRIQRLVLDEILGPLDLSNFEVCVECIKGKRTNMRKLKIQILDVFKSFKAEIEFQLGKKIKAIKSNHSGEYYECGIVLQYIMSGKPSMNDGEDLKTTVYILNMVSTKTVNKTPYELWTGKSQAPNTCTFGVVQLKHGLMGRMKENWI